MPKTPHTFWRLSGLSLPPPALLHSPCYYLHDANAFMDRPHNHFHSTYATLHVSLACHSQCHSFHMHILKVNQYLQRPSRNLVVPLFHSEGGGRNYLKLWWRLHFFFNDMIVLLLGQCFEGAFFESI